MSSTIAGMTRARAATDSNATTWAASVGCQPKVSTSLRSSGGSEGRVIETCKVLFRAARTVTAHAPRVRPLPTDTFTPLPRRRTRIFATISCAVRNFLPTHRPVVYVSGGSSGAAGILSNTADALGDRNVSVIAATGNEQARDWPQNFYTAPYLPGAMEAGVAVQIRSGRMPPRRIRAAVGDLLSNPTLTEQAQALRSSLPKWDSAASLRMHIEGLSASARALAAG